MPSVMPSVHTIQDNYDDNHHDGSESEAHSATPHTSRDEGPAAENLTSYSQRRRRKSRRRTMGMERIEYIIKGSDPFDYEQKFSEDKQHEEMGPTARVWRTYLEECAPFDIEMVEGWRDGLDVLLVFVSTIAERLIIPSLIEEKAGLFSAVVTTFVAQTSQSLQVDYGQVTTSLLIELISVQRSAANGSLVNDVPRSDLAFRPSMSDSWVNGLWFTSLSLSLATALFAVLTKQWIHQYMSVPSGTPQDRCRVRQFRYMGLQQWRVAFIIGLLPVLMSTSLAAFLVGLVLFIVPLRVSIASVVGVITFISFSAYIVTNFLPIVYPSCPYKTPLSQYIFPLYTYILRIFNWLLSPISKLWTWSAYISTPPAPTIRTLRDAEHAAVEDSADETDVQALAWLFHMSSNPSVWNIVIESTSALPLKSVKSLERRIARISYECSTALETLGSSQDVSVHESKVDRLLRAHLRFTDSFYIRRMPRPAKQCFSPSIYADLLSIQKHCRKEIRGLVISNLKAVPDDPTALRLQPIVWAYLLQKLLPSDLDDLEVRQLLFIEIPMSYWSPGFIPPTPVIEREGMKLFDEDSTGTTLRMAIQRGLYLYVAEVILFQDQLFHMHFGERSLFWDDNHINISSPPDSRLNLLLNMACSPSMRSMVFPASPFFDSLFSKILRGICDILGVNSYNNNTPAVALDTNRYAALKLLYTLILSAELDYIPPERMNAVWTTFFRVKNSTFPLPSFLAKDDWFIQPATKSVQIAFEYPSRASLHHKVYYHTAYELCTYFFQHTSFTNEALAYFVSTLFEQLREQDGPGLSVFLDLIVTRLASEDLDAQIRQKSLEYLHEPDNLFTSCTALITWGYTNTIRRLARLCPQHPAWPGCLQLLLLPQDFEFPERGMHVIPRPVSDLEAVIEAGRQMYLGRLTWRPAISCDQGDEDSPQHTWSTVWRRVRRFIPGAPSREMGLSSRV
ncbi:uncharacterized protein ARMOST_00373 [Armillaria ostoyae]|uniref:DUF6535 domain-containing protein n=1 Tax=Armillaria ostoyae TaxID=47428 RepID=A0A284QKY8_ARMOS|nr:uncharacterized protein ARMOST_00373 [Armillaria ostoyae]